MDWNRFKIGFWHPYGPHGGEHRDPIIERKTKEIENTGWTLWSFQHRTDETIESWLEEIKKVNVESVFVLCSDSKGAADPQGQVGGIHDYRLVGTTEWRPLPPTISIPHPSSKVSATAFLVSRIIRPEQIKEQPNFTVEVFKKNEGWSDQQLYTRPELLIRRGGSLPLRRVYAVLELRYPYIAQLRK